MSATYIAMLVAAFALMGSPGPATLGSAGAGAAYGFRKGAKFAAGVTAGTISVLFLIATGVTGIITTVPALNVILLAAGSAYILYLAWKIATAPPVSAVSSSRGPGFVPAYLMAIVNPKAYAAIGSVYAGFRLEGLGLLMETVVKVGSLALVAVIVNITWLAAGHSLSSLMQSPTASRRLNIAFAILLVASVALTLFL